MSYPSLTVALWATHRRLVLQHMIQRLAIFLTWVVITALLAATIDYLWEVPAALRCGLAVLGGAIGAGLIFVGVSSLWRFRFHERRLARQLETRLHDDRNVLINAVDLSETSSAGASVALRNEVLVRGQTVVQHLDLARQLPMRNLRAPLIMAMLTLALGIFISLGQPSFLTRAFWRYCDPWGDHPRFTRLQFAWTILPTPIFVGQVAEVDVAISGPQLPEQADLWQRDAVSGEVSRIPLVFTRDARFRGVVRATKTCQICCDSPQGRSDWITLTVNPSPRWNETRVHYIPPKYTAWPERTERLAAEGIRGLAQTIVELEVDSNVPLQANQLTFEPAHETPLANSATPMSPGDSSATTSPESTSPAPTESPSAAQAPLATQESAGTHEGVAIQFIPDKDHPTRGRARWVLERPGTLRWPLLGADGAPGEEVREIAVSITADHPPRIAITSPETTAEAVEGWKVPVEVRVQDDIHVAHAQMFVSVNDEPFREQPLELTPTSRNRQRLPSDDSQHAKLTWDLEQMGLKPGDKVRYFASARDNRPDNPQVQETAIHHLEVLSAQEYAEQVEATLQMAELSDELQELTESLEALNAEQDRWADQVREQLTQPTSPERWTELGQQAQHQIERREQLAEQMARRAEGNARHELEKAYQEQLREMAQTLRGQAGAQEEVQQALQEAGTATPSPEAGSDPKSAIRDALAKWSAQRPTDGSNPSSLEPLAAEARQLALAEQIAEHAAALEEVIRQQHEVTQRMETLAALPTTPTPTTPTPTTPTPTTPTPTTPTPTTPTPTTPTPTTPTPTTPTPTTPTTTTPTPTTPTPTVPSASPISPTTPTGLPARAQSLAREQERLEQQTRELEHALGELSAKASRDLPRMAASAGRLSQTLGQMRVAQDQRNASQAAHQNQGPTAHQSAVEADRKLQSLLAKCSNCQGKGEANPEIDTPLALSRESLRQQLSRMASSRARKPGEAIGTQGIAGRRGLYGPLPPSAAWARKSSRRPGGQGLGPEDGEWMEDEMAVDRISAGERQGEAREAVHWLGVPAAYREQTDAYFRRLAEDPEPNTPSQ